MVELLTCEGHSFSLGLMSFFLAVTRGQLDDINRGRTKQASSRSGGGDDQSLAETAFGGGGGGGGIDSKYFQEIYMLQSGPHQIEFGHVCESPEEWEQRYEKKDFEKNRHQGKHLPEHDKYEFGYRRGNDHHVREHYEKAIPHEGHFKTKVRWADHKGGHGEHYWDYNHAGHGDDGEGEYSDPVPTIVDSNSANSNNNPRVFPRRPNDQEASRRALTSTSDPLPKYSRHRTSEASTSVSSEAEGFLKSFDDQIGGVERFDIQRETSKKKSPVKRSEKSVKLPSSDRESEIPSFLYDAKTGKIIDEKTGKSYILQPTGVI